MLRAARKCRETACPGAENGTLRRSSESQLDVESPLSGHNFPSGFLADCQVWVEVQLRDPSGVRVFHLGQLDSNATCPTSTVTASPRGFGGRSVSAELSKQIRGFDKSRDGATGRGFRQSASAASQFSETGAGNFSIFRSPSSVSSCGTESSTVLHAGPCASSPIARCGWAVLAVSPSELPTSFPGSAGQNRSPVLKAPAGSCCDRRVLSCH